MTEVTDTPQAEPSMEEILASIRKIIADDNVPAAEAVPVDSSEVVELTHMLGDDGTVVDLATTEKETDVDIDLDEDPPAPPEPEPEVVENTDTLVSAPTEVAAVSSMAALANTVAIERLASTPHSSTHLGDGSRTLEDMVLELMRPMLKDWLDKNLPATVDRIVQKEVERISKRAQNDE